MEVELYKSETHCCVAFTGLVSGAGVQANQFLVVNGDKSALIDPGGALTYTPLSMAISRWVRLKNLTYVLASHQDPDIIASVDKWMLYSNCEVAVSRLWGRFVPHFVPSFRNDPSMDRYLLIPDEGMNIMLGDAALKALPAHFLHSVGNFSFYDPISKILFSGDIGASLGAGDASEPVEDFDAHIAFMQGFHQRYMVSNQMCRYWVNMVRTLDIDMLVPQHGKRFEGREMVNRFLDWLEQLTCGIDHFSQSSYQVP